LDPIGGNLDDDSTFRDEVNEYLRARRLLVLARTAFFTSQSVFRTRASELAGKGGRLGRRAFAASLKAANSEAREVVTRAPE
jgi:hypothetical protein